MRKRKRGGVMQAGGHTGLANQADLAQALRIEHLSHRFGATKALDSASLRDALRTVPSRQAFNIAVADGRSMAHRAGTETDARPAHWCREALTLEGVPLMEPA